MNPQDHLDNLLEAARIIRFELKRDDIGFVLIGSGDAYPSLLAQRDAAGLQDCVEMPGTVPWCFVLATLGAVDICVQPDPPTAFNSHLTLFLLFVFLVF